MARSVGTGGQSDPASEITSSLSGCERNFQNSVGSWPILILLAKSDLHTIYVRHELQTQVCQRISSYETDFASSHHDRRSPPPMKMGYNLSCAAGAARRGE